MTSEASPSGGVATSSDDGASRVLAGITDVAALAGVSTATVSRALRGLPNVSTKTRERVQQAADQLGYVASASASSLASGRTRTIGVVTPYIGRWFFALLIDGIQESLREAGYGVLLYTIGEHGEDRGRAFDPDSLRKRVEGIIILSVPVTRSEIAALEATHIPTALAGFTASGFPSVRIDDSEAAGVATKHLIGLGHTRIAHIGAKDEVGLRFPVPQARHQAYLSALRGAGIEPDPELDRIGDFSITSGAEAMAELLSLADPPTAVFAGSDEMAFGALDTARKAGLHVPEDLSIIGIDDHEFAPLFDLTTVAQPVRLQGRLVAELLLESLIARDQVAQVADPDSDTDGVAANGRPQPRTIVVPTKLILRGSTAPPGRPRQLPTRTPNEGRAPTL